MRIDPLERLAAKSRAESHDEWTETRPKTATPRRRWWIRIDARCGMVLTGSTLRVMADGSLAIYDHGGLLCAGVAANQWQSWQRLPDEPNGDH